MMRLVEQSNYNTKNSYRSAIPRESDAHIYFRQYPLGWLFFSVPHVDGLLQLLGTEMPGIKFEDITEIMLKVYDFNSRDTYADPDDQATLTEALKSMDAQTIQLVREMRDRLQGGREWYFQYLSNPNRNPPNPANDNAVDKAVINATTTGFIDGGSFDTSTSRTKPQTFLYGTIEPLTKYA